MACWTLCTRPFMPYSDELTAFSTAEASAMSELIRLLTDWRLTSSSASSNDSLTSDSGWAGTSMLRDRSFGSTGMDSSDAGQGFPDLHARPLRRGAGGEKTRPVGLLPASGETRCEAPQ